RPAEDSRGRDKAHGHPCQNDRDESLPQIRAADRCRLHRKSSVASTCTRRSFTSICRKGVTSRASVAASTSCWSERRRKISPTRYGSASMSHISVATRLKSKYEPAARLRTTVWPSTSATANSFSRTRTLAIVMLKLSGSTAAWRRRLYPRFASAGLVLVVDAGRHRNGHLERKTELR